ncbi:GOLPH3/VPS74 family protein [Amycolatopsis magusensis]|uniref:GOLPH3/VPS74 family protein n=1 Tax=Amycolatopsis magusensis TaxID=882444 RepID=UPI0024A7CA36|nr:GPP34 family phosphoprotein [Amycolatopsis magusensis]MDI5981338.1 GPP34 family phosphoprotein [Amycolatopsis magusensis]
MSSPRELSLPARVYLLSCRGGRVPDRQRVGYLVRAAALTELLLCGRILDQDGLVGAVPGGSTGDAVLDEVLGQIVEGGSRKWRHWVRKDHRRALDSVEEQLSAERAIVLTRTRVFRLRRVEVRDTASVERLRATVDKALRGNGAVSQEDAALVALVAAVELKGVVPGRERRRNKERLRELEDHGGAAIPALRKVFKELRQARTATVAANGNSS